MIFVDEARFNLSGNQFTTYAPKGKGVTLRRYQSVTEGVYSISGITPKGGLIYGVQKKAYCSKQVIVFLNRMLDRFQGKLHVVWDNASIHVSKAIKEYLNQDRPNRRLTLYALPRYCPELNVDEQVWNHLKNYDLIRQEFRGKKPLMEALEQQLKKIQLLPELIQSFFRHPQVKFA